MQERATVLLTAMIADDEQLAQDELAYLLKDFPDIEVVGSARHGLEAVELIQKLEPDLVVYCVCLNDVPSVIDTAFVLDNTRNRARFKLFPEAMLGELRQKGCTGLAGVPSTYQILLRRSRFSDLAFPRLRWFQQAGGKLPNPCIQQLLDSFPQVKYFLMYGQTEGTAPGRHLHHRSVARHLDLLSVGYRALVPAADPRRRGVMGMSFRGDAKHRTRNLEIPGLVLRTIPE